ncbi:centromere protein K [Conger conger]|uniref:centromere protein K n=1 Tax=Conger conger TaxID=82655 RepID=UPI002A5AF0BD|nr:centromere protein K [Conger conger]
MDADELMENAQALAKQMSEYQGNLPPDTPVSRELSEAARAELLDECEEQFSLLQQLQNDLTLAEAESLQNPNYQTVSRVNALEAELKEWQELQPKLLSSNPEVLLAVGKEELSRLNRQLEMVLSCSQAKRDKLKETLKSEQEWVGEKKEVLQAAAERVAALRDEGDRLSEKGVLQDMKKKIQRVKDYHDNLMETLSDILAEHFPLPQQEGNANKKGKNILPEPTADVITLREMLELLMNKLVETPHEPYIEIDGTFWPPYIELLLRYGMALRHPEDCSKIRLEAFF